MPSPIRAILVALRACVALLLLGLSFATAGQEVPGEDGPAAPAAAPAAVSAATLEARRAALEADTSLPEDARSRAVDFLARAVDEEGQSAAAQVKAAALAQRIAAAPARIEELKALLAKDAGPVPEPADHAKASLEDLTRLEQEGQRELQRARDQLAARERDVGSLTALGPSLSEEVASRKRAIRDIREDSAVSAVGEPPVVIDALSDYVAARRDRLSAENALAELTLANFDQLVRLATLERDAATLRVTRLDAQFEALASALKAARVRQAKEGRQQAKVAEQATANLPGPVAALSAENAKLREDLERVTLRAGDVAEQLRVTQRRASELESDLVTIRERVDTVGPTAAIGRLLRKRLQSLTGIETDRRAAAARSDEIVAATDRRIDLGEQRRELAVIAPRVDQILAAVPEDEAAGFDEAWLREQITVLVTAKRTTIDALYEAYGRYLTQVNSFDAAQRQLASTAEVMRVFVRRELLWTQTLPAISLSDFSATGQVLSTLFALDSWREALISARANAVAHAAPTLVFLTVVFGFLGLRPWARRRLGALGQLVSRIRTDAFRHTAMALLLTLLIAAAWPVFVYFLGWLLGVQEPPGVFASHVSATLERLARLLAIFAAVRWFLDGNGLARRHFRWPEPVCLMLRREFRWLTELGLVCVVLGVYGSVLGTDAARVALSRPALMIFAVALAVLFWRVFGGRSPLIATMRLRHPHSFTVRTWRVWFPLLVAVPVAIVAAAGAGYYDAARTSTMLLIDTGWLMLGVWVLRDVMLRWFTVSERRLRFEQAIKQRDEARAERKKQQQEEEDPEAALGESPEVEIAEVDYRELGEQGRAVVQVAVILGVLLGLLKLWSDLLPAFTLLDRIELPFTHLLLVEGVEQRVAVTATDVALAVLVLAGTLFAARNLSGLLGFTVLRRLTGDAGAQYAIVTLCQYALVAAGVMYVFSSIGVQWSKLQWLVAALGVGLGFGLQEIVANFVSGIILLLERPVRVGDTVTVGDATGTVSRIRIRATTIVDWDRKELVVPNKEFITGRLLNWTLSNDLLRVIIPVGVAYGSDVRRARQLLLEAAEESEHVLDDPAPQTVFDNFGDNALGLELRVYLPSISHFLPAKTELHDTIYDKLNAAGIVIAFPQRDVHLDTNTPLDIRVHDASSVRRAPWQRAKDRKT